MQFRPIKKMPQLFTLYYFISIFSLPTPIVPFATLTGERTTAKTKKNQQLPSQIFQ